MTRLPPGLLGILKNETRILAPVRGPKGEDSEIPLLPAIINNARLKRKW
jgi:hypothetical protein